jgi:hypothetical protein
VIVVWKKLQKDLGIEDRNRRKRKTKTFDLVKNREDLDTLSKFLGDYSFYEIRGWGAKRFDDDGSFALATALMISFSETNNMLSITVHFALFNECGQNQASVRTGEFVFILFHFKSTFPKILGS